MSSLFITFEGPEGSGKTTQASLLVESLNELDYKVKLTREPGGDPVSEDIRRILLDSSDGSIADTTELLLYIAARAQHTEQIIIPHLNDGFVVVCARYADSTLAYQGYGSGLDISLIERMNAFATYGTTPDMTFLLDIDTEVGLSRQQEWNRIEHKAVEYHKRVRTGFLDIAAQHSERVIVVDASQDIQTIQNQILERVKQRLAGSA